MINKQKKNQNINETVLERVGNSPTVIHQIANMYLNEGTNYPKLLKKIKDQINNLKQEDNFNLTTKKDIVLRLLRLHKSSSERINNIIGFYEAIFQETGKINSILDLGMGFNSLSLLFLENIKEYKGVDITKKEIIFLEEVLNLLEINKKIDLIEEDVLSYKDNKIYDLILMLKIAQDIEKQSKENFSAVLAKLNFRYAFISFPTKTLGGGEKNMKNFYSSYAENLLKEKDYTRLEFPEINEFGYLVKQSTI